MSTLVCSVSFGRNVTGGGRAGAGGRASGRAVEGGTVEKSVGRAVCMSVGRPSDIKGTEMGLLGRRLD